MSITIMALIGEFTQGKKQKLNKLGEFEHEIEQSFKKYQPYGHFWDCDAWDEDSSDRIEQNGGCMSETAQVHRNTPDFETTYWAYERLGSCMFTIVSR